MPQLDFYHVAVRRALEKAGWSITEDPFSLKVDGIRVQIDLAAENSNSGTNGNSRLVVAVEIKSFVNTSAVNEFQKALGQYLMYSEMLEEKQMAHQLYLALERDIYQGFFQKSIIRKLVRKHGVKIVVFSAVLEEVVTWTH